MIGMTKEDTLVVAGYLSGDVPCPKHKVPMEKRSYPSRMWRQPVPGRTVLDDAIGMAYCERCDDIHFWTYLGEIRRTTGDPDRDLRIHEIEMWRVKWALCVNPETGEEDPFRMARILNDGWTEFCRRVWDLTGSARRIDEEAFRLQAWQDLNQQFRSWCAMNFDNTEGTPALDMTPQEVLTVVEDRRSAIGEHVEYAGG